MTISSKNQGSRKIGVSALVFGIKGLLQGPYAVYQKARLAGADGLQLIPIWFWKNSEISLIPSSEVLSFEDAWNEGSLIKSFTNIERMKRDRYLNWVYDLILFMGIFNIPRIKTNLFKKLFVKAIPIDFKDIPGSVVETQPDYDAYWLNGDYPLVVDIFHIHERFKDDPNAALIMIRQIAHRAVCIHLQCRDADWTEGYIKNLFAGRGYLHDALSILMKEGQRDAPVIIEIMEASLNKKGFTMAQLVNLVRNLDAKV